MRREREREREREKIWFIIIQFLFGKGLSIRSRGNKLDNHFYSKSQFFLFFLRSNALRPVLSFIWKKRARQREYIYEMSFTGSLLVILKPIFSPDDILSVSKERISF